MRTLRSILLFAIVLISTVVGVAQDVIVTVAPTRPVLPPQALLYVADPGKYFTIQLTNTTAQPQDVYLGLQIEQIMPKGDLAISTPPNRQPQEPFSVPANGQRTLTTLEMKHLFDHIPSNEINAPSSLFENYSNGSFGLLPEGQYQIHVTAYRWSRPQTAKPIVVSNPNGGVCFFTVCYSAQSPVFILPTTLGAKEMDVAEVDPFNALFTWQAPILTCASRIVRYEYSLRIVEVPDKWSIDQAMDYGPLVYQRSELMVPQCIIPQNIITSQFFTNKRYAARVTAKSTSSDPLDYTMITNNGMSDIRVFRIKTSDEPKVEPKVEPKEEEKKEEEKKEDANEEKPKEEPNEEEPKEEEEAEPDIFAIMGNVMANDSLNTDSLYTFRNPTIIEPFFLSTEGARKKFMESTIYVKWDPVHFLGGEGLRSDTIQFAYDVELFDGGQAADLKSALEGTPIYTNRITTEELKDSIPWEDLKDKVEAYDYLVLRVKPIVTKGRSVAFTNDSVNVRDFALSKRLTKTYFQCSNTVEINNEKPTTKSADDYKGQTVAIGEYELTIDKISGSGASGFSGEGRVKWEPLGATIMVCVKFDNLKINTDDIVYEGECLSYSENSMSDIQVVDKLFSDWGIDNLIGDSGIPYASYVQSSATNAVKDIAKQIDLSKYYSYIKKGNALKQLLTSGKIDKLYMPIGLPKEINKTPVDIQIAHMKFAATYATMDIIGEFTLPNSNYLKNDILVFGAPRLCISPNRVLPESGTIALLSDFGIKDPKSGYEMTFKAPKDVMAPNDGCYISWHADKLELLGIDVDMLIPRLVKDVNGVATKEKPILNVCASFSEWDDWMIDNISIDPFQVEDLPGWTFTAQNIVYDHSLYRNSPKMGAFPKNYDKKSAGITQANNTDWQGLYIKKIGIRFPKSLEFGTSGDKRLEIAANDMFFDKSGASLSVEVNDGFSAKTGKAGGWEFSLDKVQLGFIQSKFDNCKFAGKFGVPLLKGQVGYECRIMKLTSNAANAGQYAYVFKTQQVDGLSLDFFLADAKFNKDQTYFLLESLPNAQGKQETKVELLMGGDLTIGGTDYLNKKIKNSSLPLKFEIPGVHFCGMRLANCPNSWTSKYESAMQTKAKNASLTGKQIYKGKEFQLASGKVYFHTGRWSLASQQKKLGPFEFSLDKYEFDYQNPNLKVTLEGSIKLISSVELSADAGISIYAKVKMPSSLDNLKDFSASYDRTEFNRAHFGTKFAGVEIDGNLTVERNANDREGYSGDLTFKMPGDLFSIEANGGYYKKKSGGNTQFTYGWFYASVGGKAGIPIDPVKITRLTAGFYYNCRKNGTKAEPEEGIIGVVAGLGLATTAGQDMMSGDFDMTVIYDRQKNRLSTFLLTGKLQAVNELVKADANILYQNDNTDQYLKIDVTVDASADGEKLTQKIGGSTAYKSLGDLKQKLNSGYTKLKKIIPQDGLSGKVDDKKTNSDPSTSAPNKGQNLSASAGAKITLNFQVTMKEKGQQLKKVKWHLYLGEPEISKRCTFTFLKINSSILKVNFGANAYVCIGNELPNNGKLPDIPYEIRKFLDGSTSGKGIESADVSKANQARAQSMQEFNDQIAQTGGGVMFGAQIYGYIDVDLGIFYLDAGATAGFDISIVKLPSNAYCTNISGMPGWKGWYGYGQLYAYLYAKFGLRLNLGFWSKDFDIADAGIGGLFRMQGPKPSHFDGEARVKLKLLGGLIDINRKYQFSAGDECNLFAGNALDNFKLFGDLSIGYAEKEKGWADKNKIEPDLLSRPVFYTEAPLKEPFRVLDETELNRLKKNYDGNAEDLEMEASRTFIFRSNVDSKVTIKEYKSKTDKYPTTRTFYLKGQSRYANYIDITQLTPERYYEMTVTGYAKEIVKGQEVNPMKWNASAKKYYSEAWSQSKTYYFATTARKAIPDQPDLQDYVAIAYPSYRNKIVRPENYTYMAVHDQDIKMPTIALTTNLYNKAFKQGKLKWRLYDSNNKKVCERDNSWVYSVSTCNMQPTSNISGYSYGKNYKLKLEYETSKRNAQNKVVTETAIIMEVWVTPQNTNWKTGYYDRSLAYEAPFVGCRINNVTFANTPSQITDYGISRDSYTLGGRVYRLYDPYLFIAYMSNYAFPGGWEFTADRIDMNVTTSQSVVYTDKGGVYEGKLGGDKNNYNCYWDYDKIKSLSIYDRSQWKNITSYPLPVLSDYSYTLTGQERAAVYTPSTKRYVQVKGYISDMYSVYEAAARFSNKIYELAKQIDKIDADNKTFTNEANGMENWYQARRGQYASSSFNKVRLQVPCYQFPIVWGSMLNNSGAKKKLTMWGTLKGYTDKCKKFDSARGHESNSEWVFCGFLGSSNVKGDSMDKKNKHARDEFKNDDTTKKRMTKANFTIYRVNAYDFNDCNYTVRSGVNGGNAEESFDINYPLTYYNQK